MNERTSTAASIAIHAGFLALLSAVSWRALHRNEMPSGMEFEIVDKEYARAVPDAASADAKKESVAHSAPESRSVATGTEKPAPVKDEVERRKTAEALPQEAPKPLPANSASAPAPQPAIPDPADVASNVTPTAVQPVPQLPDVPQLGPGEVSPPQVPQPTGSAAPSAPQQPAPQMASAPSSGSGEAATDGRDRQVNQMPATQVADVRTEATTPNPVPGPERRQLNSQALSRFIDAQGRPNTRSRLNSAAIGSAIGAAVPRGASGLRLRERVNLEQMIRSQITPCWNPPSAEEGVGGVSVLMRIRLDHLGAVVGFPTLSELRGPDSPYARAVVSSVRRAIVQCSPLKLPPELYEAWSDVELNFDPKDVL